MSKSLLIEVRDSKFTSKKEGDKFFVEGILTHKDEKRNQNGRIYPEETLFREVEKYKNNVIKENRAMGELDHPDCVASGSLIMTYEGWKPLENIKNDEIIATLNIETNKIEYQKITEKIDQEYKGTMYRVKGRNINILVTPNHRFVVRDRKGKLGFDCAENLYNRLQNNEYPHLSIPSNSFGWDKESPEKFLLKRAENVRNDLRDKYSEDIEIDFSVWMGFIGIYLAEGYFKGCRRRQESVKKSGYSITISQNEGIKKDKIRELLNKFPEELKWKEVKCGFTITDARLHNYVSKLGSCYDKYIPQELKEQSIPLLEELLEFYFIGDGRAPIYKGRSSKDVFSTSKKLIEDLHEILTKTGCSGSIAVEYPKKDYKFAGRIIKAKNKSPLWLLTFKTTGAIHIDPRFLKIEKVDYDGRVYCVKVPNQTFYAMNEGKCFWSGNSSVINLKNVSHNIVSCWWEGDSLIGKLEILGTPCGNIAKALFEAGIPVGISSRALGSVKTIGENTVEVQDDLELLAFDLVSTPSANGAYLQPLHEAKGNIIILDNNDRINEIIREILTTI